MLTTEVQGYRSGINGNEDGKWKLLGGKGLVDEPPFLIKDKFVDGGNTIQLYPIIKND